MRRLENFVRPTPRNGDWSNAGLAGSQTAVRLSISTSTHVSIVCQQLHYVNSDKGRQADKG